ncbi:MAG: O-antigen/teichoic acid export membrane protein [Planctomycetota bacterium]
MSAAPQSKTLIQRVQSGTLLLVLGRIWGSACTFVALYLLAKQLTGDDFGRYTFYLAAFMLLDSFVDCGTGAIAVQRTADDEGLIGPVLGATRRIRLVAGLIGVALVGGGAFLANEPGAGWILLASFYPVTHVLELSATVFRTRIAWGIPVAVRAFSSGLSLAFILLLLLLDVSQPGLYLCGLALGSASANVVLHLVSRKHLPHARVAPAAWRPILAAALPLGLAGVCQQTYFYVDNIFIRSLLGEVPLGHYNVGIRMMSMCIMVGVYAALVSLPWFKRQHTAGKLGPAVARLAQPLFAAAGLAAGLLFPWSAELLRIFGDEFTSASDSLRWLLGAAVLVYVGAVVLNALVATGHTGLVLAVAVGGLLTNLLGNALLVPHLGIDGAAIATFATEGIVVVGGILALRKAGVSGLAGQAGWRWVGGPLLFCAALLISRELPILDLIAAF